MAFWIFIFPSTQQMYKEGATDEAFGDNTVSLTYFYYRSIIKNTLPLLMSITMIFGSDVIILESDWWLSVLMAITYTFTNYAVCQYVKKDTVYFMDWGVIS